MLLLLYPKPHWRARLGHMQTFQCSALLFFPSFPEPPALLFPFRNFHPVCSWQIIIMNHEGPYMPNLFVDMALSSALQPTSRTHWAPFLCEYQARCRGVVLRSSPRRAPAKSGTHKVLEHRIHQASAMSLQGTDRSSRRGLVWDAKLGAELCWGGGRWDQSEHRLIEEWDGAS